MPPTVTERPASAELRDQLLAAADRLRELRAVHPDRRADTHRQDTLDTANTLLELDREFEARARIERYDLEAAAWEAARQAPTPEPRGPSAALDTPGERQLTPGEMFTRSTSYSERRDSHAFGSGYAEHTIPASIASSEARALLGGGTLTVTIGDDGGAWRPLGTPVPPTERRQRLFVRDALNVIPTGLGAIPYVRELNPATNETAATAVAEGVAKPEVTMEFIEIIAPVVKIAAWVPVTEEIIEDAPTLQGYINTRLAYMVALREEAQVLNGPGTGANMTGIRQTSGLQTQSVVPGDFPATIGLAISKVENVDGEADFVAANPLDFWVAVTTRHANQFDNGYGGNAPAIMSGVTWGLPAIRTRSMESGKALVGSRMGATIADRMQTVVRTGNQHSTFFTENKVAVLAEERIALLVHRPDLFVEATVPTS